MRLTLKTLFLLILFSRAIPAAQGNMGGSFQELTPQQQRLVVDTVSRFNRSTGQSLNPEYVYDGARVSVRTTFEAVTQALSKTKLTSKSGKEQGNALDLVDVVEDVAGEVRGARGDQQFRIYAVMKIGTIEKLQNGSEFFQDKDNIRYHRGFPVCFRMLGIPSIQISLARDGKRADIDVDYRSPKFPQALVNGHLRASNSDVRAGDNGERHNRRWSGLSEWWKMLFSFDLGPNVAESASENVAGIPSSPPSSSKQPLDTVVHDFLSAWLLEGQPRFAVPYFSRQSYSCLEAMSENRGKPLPAGVVRYEILNSMGRYAQAIGPVKNLDDATAPVKLWDTAFRPYENRYESEFTLFGVPSGIVEREECSGPAKNSAKKRKQKYGEYFGSAFRLHKGSLNEGALYLVWTRQYKKWQIVKAEYVEVDGPDLSASNNVPLPDEKLELRQVPGDHQANQSIHDFLAAWLVRGDFKTAASFVAPVAYACFDKPLEPTQGKQELLSGLKEVRRELGRRAGLADYVEPFVPEEPDFHLVTHPDETAFAILSPPASAAKGFLCANPEKQGSEAESLPPDKSYGSYYVASLRMKVTDEGEPAALYMVWTQQEHVWKVVAWQLIAP